MCIRDRNKVLHCAVGKENIFFLLLILVFAQCKVFSVLFGMTLFHLFQWSCIYAFILSASEIPIHCQEWKDDFKSPLLVLVYIEKRTFFTLSDEVRAGDCSYNSRMKERLMMLVSGMLVIQRKTYPCQLKFYDFTVVMSIFQLIWQRVRGPTSRRGRDWCQETGSASLGIGQSFAC